MAVLVLWLDRDMRPFHDELWYLCGRSLGNPASLFVPHNEHWVTLHATAYLAIAGIFGIDSSVPFLLFLMALHAAVAAAVLRLTGSLLAATAMLFFGAGYENLFWAFQIGFVGALALGLWAFAALELRRPIVAAILLVASVATVSNALFVLPAVAVYVLASRRPRELFVLAPAMTAYAAWFVLERDQMAIRGDGIDFPGAISYAAAGIVAALGFGAGASVSAGIAGLSLVARPRLTPLALAGVAGLLATFISLALVRQGFSAPDSSRYLYIAAPFVLLAIAGPARKRVPQMTALVVAIVIGATLLVSNGLAWPGYVAAARSDGADVPPPGCLHR